MVINLNNLDEAWKYNVYAVLVRPADALANAQLGMTYFGLGKWDLAEKHLVTARQIDPAHFSHPQLFLAEIHLRRGDRHAVVAQAFLPVLLFGCAAGKTHTGRNACATSGRTRHRLSLL